MRIILASQSPRRRALLESIGLDFEVASAAHEIDEAAVLRGEGNAEARLRRLAGQKGHALAQQHPGALVLSADTEVLLLDEPLGKPRERAEAIDFLRRLSGRRHSVVTAVCLQCPEHGIVRCESESTGVWFRELSMQSIERYVDSEQPYDYAGGYAIQGNGAALIGRIEGDYTNVIGLPLPLTITMLREAGVQGLDSSDGSAG